MGYSDKIHDPAFKRYMKNSNRWAAIFSVFLAVIAVVGFAIAGEISNEMDNPESLYIGLGIGAMFLVIYFFQMLGRKRSKTWDGKVTDKKVEHKKRKRQTADDDYYWENYTVYTVVFKSDEGRVYELRSDNDDTKYNYYQIGDRVRHHGGLNTYEKMDKTGDKIVFCAACASLNEIENDVCFRCKCPLLK